MQTNRKYIFIFFLSEIAEEAREQIYDFAHKNGFEVLEWSPTKNELESRVGPSEWLHLVHHASYVCTDSFHGCAFSLVFNVPFTCFERKFFMKMNTRIETLKQTFALQGIDYDGTVKIPEIDFENVNKIFNAERQRVYRLMTQWLQQGGDL